MRHCRFFGKDTSICPSERASRHAPRNCSLTIFIGPEKLRPMPEQELPISADISPEQPANLPPDFHSIGKNLATIKETEFEGAIAIR